MRLFHRRGAPRPVPVPLPTVPTESPPAEPDGIHTVKVDVLSGERRGTSYVIVRGSGGQPGASVDDYAGLERDVSRMMCNVNEPALERGAIRNDDDPDTWHLFRGRRPGEEIGT